MEARKQLRIAVIVTLGVAVACIGIATAIAVTSGFGGRVGPGSVTLGERRSFSPEGVDKVSVNAVSEKVRVFDAVDGQFSIRLYGKMRAASREAMPRLLTEVSGGVLTATVEHRPMAVSPWSDLTLEVAVPRSYAKAFAAVTVSGEVEIADHAYGALSVGTTSGAARIGAVRAEIVEARTTSGEIQVGFAGQPGTVDIVSTSGAVALALPAGSDFTLDARSVSGGISCDFPLTVSAHSERALAGVIGKGTAVVRIQTVSGRIRISR